MAAKRKRSVMGPKMAQAESQARGDRALILRARGYTLDVIAAKLGFKSRGAAQGSIRAAERRHTVRTPAEARRALLLQAEDSNRKLSERFDEAYQRGDVETMRRAHEAMVKDRDSQARLTGAYPPERVSVSAVDEKAFAEQALALLAIVGTGPLRDAAGVPQLSAPPAPSSPGLDGWANIEPSDYYGGGTAGSLYDGPPDEPPYGPLAAQWVPPHQTDGVRSSTGHTEPETTAPDVPGEPDDGEAVETVEAELVDGPPMPPGQRRGHLERDQWGIPTGRMRYLPARSYDPLAHWRP